MLVLFCWSIYREPVNAMSNSVSYICYIWEFPTVVVRNKDIGFNKNIDDFVVIQKQHISCVLVKEDAKR